MNRRPNQSRSGYDSFSPEHTARLRLHTPDTYFFEKKKRRPFWKTLLLLISTALVLFFIINLIVNQFVYVEHISVPVRGLNEAFDGFTVLHLSDLKGARFGKKQDGFSFALGKEKVDLIVITGDMLSPLGSSQPFYDLLDVLNTQYKGVPVYFIAGDSDPLPASMQHAGSGSPFASWVLGAWQHGGKLLSSPVAIERSGCRLWLAASSQLTLDLDIMQGQYERQYLSAVQGGDENEIELAAFQLSSLEAIRTARAQMTADDACITLTHALPASSDTSISLTPAGRPVDLVLSGHYLSGLLCLPGVGPLFIPSKDLPFYGLLPKSGAYSGMSRRESTWLYVSPGLGSLDAMYPPWFFRLCNPPTATLLTLTPSAL